MIKKELTEVRYCDFCGSNDSVYEHCMICGKDWCYECGKKVSETLPHSCSCSGGDDGHFCKECLVNPPEKIMPLINAYRVIQCLRKEAEHFYTSYRVRAKTAEAEVKKLYDSANN